MTLKHNFAITVDGISGAWNTFSGGGATAAVATDWGGGGAKKPRKQPGPVTFDDIELTRSYYGGTDDGWLASLRAGLYANRTYTIKKQTVDPNGVAIGKPVVYPGCILAGLTEPESESGSEDVAMVTATFSTLGPA